MPTKSTKTQVTFHILIEMSLNVEIDTSKISISFFLTKYDIVV